MITVLSTRINKWTPSVSGDVPNELNTYAGLSTDDKPTDNLATGSIFIEVDTGKKYFFNEEGEEGEQWIEYSGSGGGGGGGGSDFTTCTMTVSCTGVGITLVAPFIATENEFSAACSFTEIRPGQTFNLSVVLWKGNAVITFIPEDPINEPTLSGAIEIFGGGQAFLVTGDCGVAISSAGNAT